MDASVHTYRLQPSALQKRLRRNAMRMMLIAVSLGATAMVVTSILMTQRGNSPYSSLVIIALAMGYICFISFRKKLDPEMQAAFDGYLLTLDDFVITRVFPGHPTITFPIKSIRSVTRYRNGSLKIESAESEDMIWVSIDVENYDDLVRRFAAITEIQEQVRWPILEFLPVAGMLSGFVAFGLMLATQKPLLVGILGTLTIAGGAYSFYILRSAKIFPAYGRKISWYTLGMIGLAIYYMVVVFKGHA